MRPDAGGAMLQQLGDGSLQILFEQIVFHGQADAVCLARALLRDPYWPRHAAKTLGVDMPWPDQYKRCDVGPLGK